MRRFLVSLLAMGAILLAVAVPAAAAPAGTLDESFGTHGAVGVNLSDFGQQCSAGPQVFGCSMPTEAPFDVLGEPDGSVLVLTTYQVDDAAGRFRSLVVFRIGADGRFDPTFGSGGLAVIVPRGWIGSFSAGQLDRDGAGRTYVRWYSDPSYIPHYAVTTRLLADGRHDLSYGVGGNLPLPVGHSTVGPDGSIYLQSIAVPAAGRLLVAVTRIGPDGHPDRSYGVSGSGLLSAPTVLPGGQAVYDAYDLVAGPDGSVVVSFVAFTTSGPSPIVIGRLTPDGKADTGFGPGGVLVPTPPASTPDLFSFPGSVLVEPGGGLLYVGTRTGSGSTTSDIRAVHFDPSGAFDATYGTGGVATLDLTGPGGFDSQMWVALDGAGRLLVADGFGASSLIQGQVAIARFDGHGQLDPTFGSGGTARAPAVVTPAGHIRSFAVTGGSGIILSSSVDATGRVCEAPYGTTVPCTDILLMKLRG